MDRRCPAQRRSGSVTADKLNHELQTATDYLGRVTAHTLFANLYWDQDP